MCGLAGVMSSSLSQQEEDIFRDLLNVASLRGQEGSGVIVSQSMYNRKTPIIRSLRTKQIAGSLAYSPEFSELLKPRVNAIIGHARWPTKGGVDINSVHPHRSGHIIGVHNGTIYKIGGEDVKDRSDSQMLFESFATIGVSETMKDTRGAYALVWIDEKDQTINFLRNEQRTLWFRNTGWNKNCNTIFWSSEEGMLDFVFDRSYKGTNSWGTYLPPHKWYKYPLDVQHNIRPREVTDCKPEEIARPLPQTNRWRGHGMGGGARALREADLLDPWEDQLPLRDMEWNPATCRMEARVLHLPAPRIPSVEEHLRKLSEAPEPDPKPVVPVPASEDGPVIKPLSKQAKKRLAKQRAKEEADAAKRLKRFQVAQAAGKVVNPPKEMLVCEPIEDTSLAPPEDTFNDPLPDFLDNVRSFTEHKRDDVHRFIHCVGKGCAWCGEVANVGDNVFPTSSDLGSKDFVCYDCSNHIDVAVYISNCHVATAISS